VILRDHEQSFGERRLRLTLALADALPADVRVSAAHCLAFDREHRVLLARHVDRAWTIPGGRTEPGESAEQTMRREVLEEAAAIVEDPCVVATERIELLAGEPDPRYPSPMYQVFFIARVVSVGAVVANAETYESRLFPIDEARLLPGWIDHNTRLFDAASERANVRWPTSTN
jgi:8-oxo-dGTP pyrophosphatase MutT (NUDIX family)